MRRKIVAAPRSEPRLELPGDLRAFLEQGLALRYDAAECREVGRVTLQPLEAIRLTRFPVAVTPHKDSAGFFWAHAADLIASADGGRSDGLLMWFPRERMYGRYDSDHAVAIVYPGASWWEIQQRPPRYLRWPEPYCFAERVPHPYEDPGYRFVVEHLAPRGDILPTYPHPPW